MLHLLGPDHFRMQESLNTLILKIQTLSMSRAGYCTHPSQLRALLKNAINLESIGIAVVNSVAVGSYANTTCPPVAPYLVPTPANLPVSQVRGATAFAPRGPSPLPTPSDSGLDDKNESFLAFVAVCTEEYYCVCKRDVQKKLTCYGYLFNIRV